MIKRILLIAAMAIGGLIVAPKADAAVVVRGVAPVRRVAARAVLPPYPIARRAVIGPVYRPYVYPAYRAYAYPAYRPIYAAPAIYGPGISVWAY